MGFCIYIGRKWFRLWVWNWVSWWVKVLIFVGFDDIGYDIGDFGVKVSEMLDFTGFGGIFI